MNLRSPSVAKHWRAFPILVALVCFNAEAQFVNLPVVDQTLRLQALYAIFPGAQITATKKPAEPRSRLEKREPGKPFFTDPLKEEKFYKVQGNPKNKIESCAAENLLTEQISDTRILRFRIYRWPREARSGLLAVLQYEFSGANPAMSCASIGLLVHLVRQRDVWRIRDQYLLDSMHHWTLQQIRLVDLNSDGPNKLIVESNGGGAGSVSTDFHLFDLSHGRFDEIFNAISQVSYEEDDLFSEVFDLVKTNALKGRKICFVKTTLVEDGRAFTRPRVTRPCYEKGNVDKKEAVNRNLWLEPTH